MTHEDDAPEVDPFEGMPTSRNSPRVVHGWKWSAEVFIIGPPTGVGSDDELWAAMVVNLGQTFSDFTQLRAYIFPAPGVRRAHGRRVTRVTQTQVARMVQRVYGERLRAARRLFGARREGGWQWAVPRDVRLGFDYALNHADRAGADGRRRYATEAAHYVHTHGPAGLAALRATFDLEGTEGLKRLLDTWWRL